MPTTWYDGADDIFNVAPSCAAGEAPLVQWITTNAIMCLNTIGRRPSHFVSLERTDITNNCSRQLYVVSIHGSQGCPNDHTCVAESLGRTDVDLHSGSRTSRQVLILGWGPVSAHGTLKIALKKSMMSQFSSKTTVADWK